MTSLTAVAKCLGSKNAVGMGQKVGLARPFKVSDLIRLVPGFILSPWTPVTSLALQKSQNTWHAGHVNDVLALPAGIVLLASDTGGVWLFTAGNQAPLSDSWERPDMRCLAWGPQGFPHVYAGGQVEGNTTGDQLGALYETNIESTNPLSDWTPIPLLGPAGQSLSITSIYSIVVAAGQRKIVLGTNNGVFWSDIPVSGHTYAFQLANGIPQGPCHGLALGPNDGIVASPTGAPSSPATNGMYVGAWQPDFSGHTMQLFMGRALHFGDIVFQKWNNAVVVGNGKVMYAAVSNIVPVPGNSQYDTPYAVLVSYDGGTSWKPCGPNGLVAESVNFPNPQTPSDVPGDTQGGYNICIGISPTDPNTIALGWRRGPWIGRNTPGAFTWEEHGDEFSPGGASSHLHGDNHAVYFDPHDATGQTLYVATDGGVAVSRDLCQSWDSSINRSLLNHQFQSSPNRYVGLGGWSGASLVTPGLVAGALQDNGIVYAGAGPNSDLWQRIGPEEDGIVCLMLYTDTLLWCTDTTNQIQASQWNGNGFNPNTTVGVRTQKPNTPVLPSMPSTFVEPVFHPASWRKPGVNQRMFAVAVYSQSAPRQDVWGYFSNDDGTNGAWDYVATIALDPNDVGDAISNIGCDNGSTAYIGTAQGRIYYLDIDGAVNRPPGTQFKMEIGAGGWPNAAVQQFSSLEGGSAFARYPYPSQALLRLRGFQWQPLGENSGLPGDEGGFYSIAVDSMTGTLFVASDFGVYASCDLGDHWWPVSHGLPRRAHPSTLRYVQESTGARFLYLTTYGRSAYRSRLSPHGGI